MDIFSQNKVLIRTSVVLVALNLVLIGFLIFKEMRPHPEPDFRREPENKKELSAILKKELNLTNDQVVKFEAIRAQNAARKSKFKEIINQDKELLNKEMYSKNYNEEKVFALAKKIADNEYQIEISKIHQSQQLKAICNPKQLDKFENLVVEIQDYFRPKITKIN